MKKLFAVLLMIIVMPCLTGCETAKGVGKDLENTGTNIRQTVDKNE